MPHETKKIKQNIYRLVMTACTYFIIVGTKCKYKQALYLFFYLPYIGPGTMLGG